MKSFKLNRIMLMMIGSSLLAPAVSSAKTSNVNIDSFKDDFVIINVRKDARFDNGNADVVLYRNKGKYLVEKNSLKFLPIYLDKLKATSTDECSDCVFTSQVGKLVVNPSTLVGYFDYNPLVVIPEVISDNTTARREVHASHAAGWVNIFASTSGDKGHNAGSSLTLDGSQTVLGAHGNIRITSTFNSDPNSAQSLESDLSQLSYNQNFFNNKYSLKVGLLSDGEISQFSSFYGLSYGTADNDYDNDELYDSYNFDISIEQPATYKLYNGRSLIKEGFISTNRFKLTNIKESVNNGLTLVVIDRNGKKHVFKKNLTQITSDLKPWKGFWQATAGINKAHENGIGLSFEYGLPFHFNIKANTEATKSNKQISSSLQYHSVLGVFTYDYAYSDIGTRSDDQVSKDSAIRYSISKDGFNFDARYNLLGDISGEEYSASLGKTINIGQDSIDLTYSISHMDSGEYNNRINLNTSTGALTTSLTLSKDGDNTSAYINLVYLLDHNWNANSGLSKSTISSSLNFNDDNFSANLNTTYERNSHNVSNSLNIKRNGRYGSLYGSISDTKGAPYSVSYIGGAVWEDNYFGIVPFAKDSVGLVTTTTKNPEQIYFNYGGDEYNLRNGYSVFAISGDYDTNIVFKNKTSAISTFNQNEYDFNPRKYFGDKFEISVLSGGLFLYSNNNQEHGIISIKDKNGKILRSIILYASAGGFIDGLSDGRYTAVYKSSLDHRTCSAAIDLTNDYKEKSLKEIFSRCSTPVPETLIVSPFEFNSHKLSSNQKSEIYKYTTVNSSVPQLFITGHAGHIGGEAGNLKISKFRAIEAQRYIGSLNANIKTTISWKGSKNPVSKINTENRTITVSTKV